MRFREGVEFESEPMNLKFENDRWLWMWPKFDNHLTVFKIIVYVMVRKKITGVGMFEMITESLSNFIYSKRKGKDIQVRESVMREEDINITYIWCTQRKAFS